jgi:hypothetical protein
MIKIQIDLKFVNTGELLPDSLANNLGGFLIIPAPGAPQVPLRMVSLKFFHFSVLCKVVAPVKAVSILMHPDQNSCLSRGP